jgi:hypothetical protein
VISYIFGAEYPWGGLKNRKLHNWLACSAERKTKGPAKLPALDSEEILTRDQ